MTPSDTSRLAAGVQRVLLREVLLQCPVGIVPRSEVVHLPADLLRPSLRGVRKERELGIGLVRLADGARGARIALDMTAVPRKRVLWTRPGVSQPHPGHFRGYRVS